MRTTDQVSQSETRQDCALHSFKQARAAVEENGNVCRVMMLRFMSKSWRLFEHRTSLENNDRS